MVGRARRDYVRRMGIETILVVGFVILISTLVVGVSRAKRKARRASTGNPTTSGTGPRS